MVAHRAGDWLSTYSTSIRMHASLTGTYPVNATRFRVVERKRGDRSNADQLAVDGLPMTWHPVRATQFRCAWVATRKQAQTSALGLSDRDA